MALKVITDAASEAITTAEAKLWLKIETSVTTDDDLIDDLIVAARKWAQNFTGQSIISATYEENFDTFPIATSLSPRREFRLFRSPLISVTTITYTDGAGDSQIVSSANYIVDTYSKRARVVPKYSFVWPATEGNANDVIIRYVAGYADAASVPMPLKKAMLLKLAEFYEKRANDPFIPFKFKPGAAERLLEDYRVFEF